MESTSPHPIQNPYGYYDESTREYVITRPDTPTPWMNYLGQGGYGALISNTAGGYSFDRDPRNRRVTRYRYNSVPSDQPGRYIYLRDQENGEYWSPTWQPVRQRTLDSYECRHGAGYTRIHSLYKGIEAELLYFVPIAVSGEAPCELWVLRLTNQDSRPRRLRSFSYAELSFWDANNDLFNLDWGQHILHTRQEAGVLMTTTQFRPTVTFFASSSEIAGYDSDREVFLGRCRDLGNPIIIERGKPCNSQAARGNNIASLCHDWVLEPGESREITYLLGVTDDPETIAPTIKRYQETQAVQAAFQDLCADWQAYLTSFTVDTPDPEMNAMLNMWNQVQCRATLFWSRFVSAYETGLGRGMGTRDSAQDTLGTAHSAPQRARQNLSMLWRLQFQDGHTWHQVFPLTGEGGPGLAGEHPDYPQWFSDDHLWLIIATCAYLRETGDLDFLDERIPYADLRTGTVWDHLMRAVDFTLNHRGPHGLPRLGFSDWDDTMNLDHGSGLAESVMAAQQFCRAMLDLSDLCDCLERPEDTRRFRQLHWEMAEIINRVAWDGAWYTRAFDDDGMAVGVQSEEEHQIGLNTQTWAVIGEAADKRRARQAMESAHTRLNTEFGLALMDPPYSRHTTRVGGTSTYPPGAKENGGIFSHANTWAIVAAAKLGWAERAYQYYRQILPLRRTDADLYAVEPYVYCANICGPTHPQFGYGRNAWLTGTASWTYVAATQWILGIRPTFRGLQISPAIPPDWPGYSAVRKFRGVAYHITVERKGEGNTSTLVVDGSPVDDTIVPFPASGKTDVEVRVSIS